MRFIGARQFLLLSLMATGSQARADQTHPRGAMPGARAAGLGGAFTALSDDPSGAYYNPAGLSFGTDKQLSVSATAIQQTRLVYVKAINGKDFSETSQSYFPNFGGGLYRFGPLTLAYSQLTLESRSVNENNRFYDISTAPNFANTYSRTHQEANLNAAAGLSMALRLGQNLSLGYTQLGYYHNVKSSNHQLTELNGGGILAVDQSYETLNVGLIGVPGLMLRTKSWSVGLAMRIPYDLTTNTKIHTDIVKYLPSAAGSTTPSAAEATRSDDSTNLLEEMIPHTLQAGFAWFVDDAFLLSADVLHHDGVANPGAAEGGVDLLPTYNFSLGSELHLGPFVVRDGIFTDNASTPALSTNRANQPLHIDYKGASLTLGLANKSYDLSFGVVAERGTGQAQIVSNSNDVQNVRGDSLTGLFGGRYSF